MGNVAIALPSHGLAGIYTLELFFAMLCHCAHIIERSSFALISLNST